MRRFSLLLVAALLGCTGAFDRALERGDRFAAVGQWEDAATAYAEAVELAPRDPEAKIRLEEARRHQIEARLAAVDAMIGRGEVRAALRGALAAVRLDVQSVAAQQGLSRALAAVVAAADARRAQGELREAFALLEEVLAVSPNHPEARRLEPQLRQALADQALARAGAHEEAGRLGNALVALTAARRFGVAVEEAQRVRRALEGELRQVVRLGGPVEAGELREAIDGAPLLVVEEGGTPTVEVELVAPQLTTDHHPETATCDYVCGTEWAPNPAVQRLREEVARAEKDLSRRAEEVARREADLLRIEQGVTREQDSVQMAQERVDKARERLSECKGRWAPNRTSPCSSQESELRSRQRELEQARRGASRERDDVRRARERVDRARRAELDARRRRDRAKQELLRTPEQVRVDRRCPFSYSVERHQRRAAGAIRVDGREEPVEVVARDGTFAPIPGRCAGLAAGDPLELPDEATLRKRWRAAAVQRLATLVRAPYDEARAAAWARGVAAQQRGDAAGAVEGMVRHFLMAPGRVEDRARLETVLAETHQLPRLEALE